MPTLPQTDLTTDAPLTLKTVRVMTSFTVANQSGDETITANYVRQKVNTANGDVVSVGQPFSITRKIANIQNAQVLAAIDLLTTKLEQARVQDGLS